MKVRSALFQLVVAVLLLVEVLPHAEARSLAEQVNSLMTACTSPNGPFPRRTTNSVSETFCSDTAPSSTSSSMFLLSRARW
jgi:hypothetical protein